VPYFEPNPSTLQWFYWILPNGQQPLISSWPHAGSPRTDSRFRFKHIKNREWSASRYWLEYLDTFEGQTFEIKGYVDVQAVGVGHLFGSAGVNSGGWEATLDIQEYDSTPILEQPGVVATIRWENVPLGLWYEAKYWILDEQTDSWSKDIRIIVGLVFFFQDERSPGWIEGLHEAKAGSLPDCFNFPLIESTPGFAEGNGADAWIELDTFTGNIVNRWQWQGDFFFRSLQRAFVLVNGSVSSVISGVSSATAYFGSISVPHFGVIPLNTWVHISVERSWQSPTGALMKMFLDHVEVGSAVRGNPQLVFNRMIGNRPTSPTQWGDFDVKNFELVTGTPAVPNVQLNLPLIINACDAGPRGNDGTTHNMSLPSCP
jgi:hypothetical protein